MIYYTYHIIEYTTIIIKMHRFEYLFSELKGYLKEEFLQTLKNKAIDHDIKDRRPGHSLSSQNIINQTIVEREHVFPLVETICELMDKKFGSKINNINIQPFENVDELGKAYAIWSNMHKLMGYEIRGWYNAETNTIYIPIKKHLKNILPTLFHELTHAYMHQENIVFNNTYPKPDTISFGFKSLLYKADQNEGFCELIATLMLYFVWNDIHSPSLVDEYWLSWKLAIEGFVDVAEKVINIMPKDQIIKIAIRTLINYAKSKHNLYDFVDKVDPNCYHKRATIVRLGC